MLDRARDRLRRCLVTVPGTAIALAAILSGCTPASPGGGTQATDCPATLHCRFVPAAYEENTPGDPADFGNYDQANRPADGLKISSIVIHDTEATYADTVSVFADPTHYASSNYVVQSSTGDVTEMVRPQDVAWAVGNSYYNAHSVSIENEGFAAQGAKWYTKAEYESDARLVRYLAGKYHVPLDRAHIVGHDNVGATSAAANTTQHTDPGPFWDWNYFMSLVLGESEQAYLAAQGSPDSHGHHVVTIAPAFAANQPAVTDCRGGKCTPLPKQGASFVYLHAKPAATSPLLSDPYLNKPRSPGTTALTDWGDEAPAGGRYVLAGRKGAWTGIWYAGRVGWFYDPPGTQATARFTGGSVVTPKPGVASVPVYGAPFPEASAYPPGLAARANPVLAYKFTAGQAYVTTGEVPDTVYHVATYNSSAPHDHEVIQGKTRYYQILLNHRLYYVNASDVILKHLK